MGLRERRLAAARESGYSGAAPAVVQLSDRVPGCRLDLREWRLVAAWVAFAPDELPHRISRSRLDLRKRRLAPAIVTAPAGRVTDRL
jgi:hypothetical protein